MNSNTPQNIGEKIKQRRLELHMSLEDVARQIGVAKSTVYRYETEATRSVGLDKVDAQAKALQVSPGYLMGWEEKESDTYYQLKTTLQELDLSEDDVAFLTSMAQKIARRKREDER